jgi:hypothetical protein
MRDTSLLQLGLGLAPPWTVSRADFAPGSRFACPTCGAADCATYDTARKT